MSQAMVVDDSRAVRMILSRNLAEMGYDVCAAADGAEALTLLREDFSLVLVGEDVTENARTIRSLPLRVDSAWPAFEVRGETVMNRRAFRSEERRGGEEGRSRG